MATHKVLIMGASYGSLLASKLLFAGHEVTLICLPAEVEAINSDGIRVRMPIRGRSAPVEIHSQKLPGKVTAAGPAGIDPSRYDLVALAMQEPQYRSPGVRELLDAVAKSQQALHVDHEHAAAAVSEAHPRPEHRCPARTASPMPACGRISSPDA